MGKQVQIKFDCELNDFLARDKRHREFAVQFKGSPTMKHLVEALGVPHTEVGLVRASGVIVGLDYPPQDGEEMAVFPWGCEGCFQPDVNPRFILDENLGRLAGYLRLLGFDTLYNSSARDEDLARKAAVDGRILLTRDRRLLMRKIVSFGCCPHSLEPRSQLEEVVQRFTLGSKAQPFTRCTHCNNVLHGANKANVIDRLEPLTKIYYDEFAACPVCGRVYWKGSHVEPTLDWIGVLQGNKGWVLGE